MARTPTGHAGEPTLTDELQLTDEGLGDPTSAGFMHYSSGAFRQMDANPQAFDPRLAWAALDTGPTDGYVSGAYKQTLPAGSVFPTQIIWWTSSAATTKIMEKDITYTGVLPTTVVYKTFSNGTLLHTYTDAITYSGPFESTRTRTWT